MANKTYTSLDPAPLARAVVLWLYMLMGATVAMAAASGWQLGELSSLKEAPDPDIGLASDTIVGLSSLAYLVIALVSGFLSLKWIYRTNRNAHSFAKGLTVSPPWSIGWFFVPIAFLWKPYQGVRQTWQASARPEGWRTAARPSILPWWWALFLLSNFAASASLRLMSPVTFEEYQLAAIVDVACYAVDIVANLLFLRVVQGLSALQSDRIKFGMFEDEPVATGVPLAKTGVIGVEA